ncbi:leukocyte surface antigen CD53 [Protopterus annectens]|uniref:leukocyte surface antigen CD53 n=1 Tax=Protopterus annectens TaxID=7888 RepID=UPI001CFADC08|nr:leukocyte surface antigen CD53 [Protopterus annectens]
MAENCLKFLKGTLFIFNFIFWICGCVILSLGIYLLVEYNYGALFPSLPSLSFANILIIVGAIILVVAFLGCMGSIKENKCLLMSFFILLLIILLIEVVMAILLFIYEKKINEYVQIQLNEGLKMYEWENSTGITKAWNMIQQQMQCCGVKNATDWPQPPKSCCMGNSYSNNSESCSTYYTEGCYRKLAEWFENNFLLVGIATIIVSVIQVLGMSFAMTMYCQIVKNTYPMNL